MRFDPEDKQFYFSTQMIPGDQENEASFASFKAYQQMCLDNPGAWIRNMVKSEGDEQSPLMKVFSIIVGITVFGGIFGTILCLPVKKYENIPWIMGALMLVLGVFSIVGAQLQGSKVFAESVLCQRIEGIIGVLGAFGLLAIKFLFPRDDIGKFVMTVFCEIAFVLFLVMTVKLIGYVRAPKSVYTEEVLATCIGYVRTYVSNSSGDEIPTYTALNSPVFEYYYGGSKYQAYYDVMDSGKDGKIRVGSGQLIRINPEDPSHIMGSIKRRIEGPLAFAIASLAATIVLLVLILIWQ